MNMLNKTVILT